MTYAGYYGKDEASTGGSIVDSGTISLYGNVWKSYGLQDPYTATGNTCIEFNAELITEGEGHAICAEDDLNTDTYGGFHRRCIVFAGKEFDDWDKNKVLKISRVTEGTNMAISVCIGHLFPKFGTEIKYISFVQDNDAMPFEGSSKFWNIKLLEIESVSRVFLYY